MWIRTDKGELVNLDVTRRLWAENNTLYADGIRARGYANRQEIESALNRIHEWLDNEENIGEGEDEWINHAVLDLRKADKE